EPPVAPHLAAAAVDRGISLGVVNDVYRKLLQQVDCVVVEGIGGWRVPLNHEAFVSTLARYLGLPALLVVGLRLGCINHALLTVEAMERDEVKMLGWVANQVDADYGYVRATVTSLERFIEAPLLGMIPYLRPGKENTVPALLSEVVRTVLEQRTVPL
ncbi:MAG: dethiobiotin synthase, partial [Nitrososphaera sp.]|nr:dethiobiotin synthase [Nitrososphaera sp.]